MVPSGTSPFGPLRPAPNPGQLRCHIGDLPIWILERILIDNLLADGGLPAVSDFVVAAPGLAAKAIRIVPHLFTVCGVDEMGFRKDFRFWRKFSKLRRHQSKKGLWKVGDTSALREEAQLHGEKAAETVAIAEHQESGGIADWRKDIPAAHGIDETLWNGDIDFEQELQKLRSG
jgi:hypothetical protein